MPLVSCGVVLGGGEVVPDCVWVGPDLLPGRPGLPAPLFCVCAKPADPSSNVERATAAIIFVRMGCLRGLPPPRITGSSGLMFAGEGTGRAPQGSCAPGAKRNGRFYARSRRPQSITPGTRRQLAANVPTTAVSRDIAPLAQ